MAKKYTEEFALDVMKDIFKKVGRVPTTEDFKKYDIRPSRTYYVRKYGSIENACVKLGLVEKPLTTKERVDISIIEMKEIANSLNRHPTKDEYEKLKNKGYSIHPLQKHLKMTYTEICKTHLPNYENKLPKGFKRCTVCKEVKLINEFCVGASSCKICHYIKRNGLKNIEGWTREECLTVIDNILNEKILYINDLCDIIHNKTLDDFANLLHNYIKIGNKPLNIKLNCSYCKKEEIKHLCIYMNNKEYFCSHECYGKYKSEYEPTGEDHHSYRRIKTNCTNCDKEINVIPYNFNILNNNGDRHNFCSQECYWEYRGKYYVGENNPRFGVEWTEKQKQRQRINLAKLYSKGVFKRTTKPQRIVNDVLDDLNIAYEREYNCKYYSVDNYLTDYNLMIEVHGDYWHANPLKFKKIDDIQFKDIAKDKRKRTYIKRYKNINILYLWEKDINQNPELIKKIILHYINNNGIIDKYNSFNYSLVDGKLAVNNTLIKPYIDYTAKELNLIKKENKKIS